MREHIVMYILCTIPLLMGAWYISETVRGFVEGKYFEAGVNLMITVLMICLFVKIFFNL